MQALLLNCLRKKNVTLKEIQALVGALKFFSRAVPSARAFNRRFYDATCGLTQPHHFIRINTGIREYLEIWLTFLRDFNGKRYFLICSWHHSEVLQLFTDSAGKSQLACGAFFNGQRNLVLCLLQNNTTFRSEHVPGSSNKIADSIARKQWSRFRTLAPEADEFPTKIPTPFAEMIFNLKLTDC